MENATFGNNITWKYKTKMMNVNTIICRISIVVATVVILNHNCHHYYDLSYLYFVLLFS